LLYVDRILIKDENVLIFTQIEDKREEN